MSVPLHMQGDPRADSNSSKAAYPTLRAVLFTFVIEILDFVTAPGEDRSEDASRVVAVILGPLPSDRRCNLVGPSPR